VELFTEMTRNPDGTTGPAIRFRPPRARPKARKHTEADPPPNLGEDDQVPLFEELAPDDEAA